MSYLLKDNPPDIVISGPNEGPNLGAAWVHSGTISAAYYASLFNVPSLALSVSIDLEDMSRITHFAHKFIEEKRHHLIPYGVYLTFSFPKNMGASLEVTQCDRYPIFCSTDFQGGAETFLMELDAKKIGENEYVYHQTHSGATSRSDSDISAYKHGKIAVKIMFAGPYLYSESKMENLKNSLQSFEF